MDKIENVELHIKMDENEKNSENEKNYRIRKNQEKLRIGQNGLKRPKMDQKLK